MTKTLVDQSANARLQIRTLFERIAISYGSLKPKFPVSWVDTTESDGAPTVSLLNNYGAVLMTVSYGLGVGQSGTRTYMYDILVQPKAVYSSVESFKDLSDIIWRVVEVSIFPFIETTITPVKFIYLHDKTTNAPKFWRNSGGGKKTTTYIPVQKPAPALLATTVVLRENPAPLVYIDMSSIRVNNVSASVFWNNIGAEKTEDNDLVGDDNWYARVLGESH